MTWRNTGEQEQYGKTFTMWRCWCGKQGVTSNGGEPSPCAHGKIERVRR